MTNLFTEWRAGDGGDPAPDRRGPEWRRLIWVIPRIDTAASRPDDRRTGGFHTAESSIKESLNLLLKRHARWFGLAAGLPLLVGAVACGTKNGDATSQPGGAQFGADQGAKPTAAVEQLSAAEIAKLASGMPAAQAKPDSSCFSVVKSYRDSFELKAGAGSGTNSGSGAGTIRFSGAFGRPIAPK